MLTEVQLSKEVNINVGIYEAKLNAKWESFTSRFSVFSFSYNWNSWTEYLAQHLLANCNSDSTVDMHITLYPLANFWSNKLSS